jgi:DNA gyrase subunit A
VAYLFPARSLDTILFFSDRGKVYSEKAHRIPESDRADRGTTIANVLSVTQGETITAAVAVSTFESGEYCTMATRNGKIKRVQLSEFEDVRPSGLVAITLEEGDVLGWVRVTTGAQEIILVTEKGQALRYSEKLVRPMGRQAAGVAAIRRAKDDFVASMEVVDLEGDLLVATFNGYGKRTPIGEYTPKGRATGGVATIAQKMIEITGRIAAARMVRADDDLTIITAGGQALRLKVKQVRRAGRATMGTHMISLKEGDTIASVARISADLQEEANGGETAESSTAAGEGEAEAPPGAGD